MRVQATCACTRSCRGDLALDFLGSGRTVGNPEAIQLRREYHPAYGVIRQLAIQFRHSPISHRKQAMRVSVHLRSGHSSMSSSVGRF